MRVQIKVLLDTEVNTIGEAAQVMSELLKPFEKQGTVVNLDIYERDPAYEEDSE